MTQPFESGASDATVAWCVWIGFASTGNGLVSGIQTWMSSFKNDEDGSGPLHNDVSAAYVNRGSDYLTTNGFATLSGGTTLVPAGGYTTATGQLRALHRKGVYDPDTNPEDDIELDPSGLPEKQIHP